MVRSTYWRFGQFGRADEVLEKAQATLPDPGPGQVLVEILSVGLNQAENRYLLGKHFPPSSLPACLSHEAVGKIIALGPPSAERRPVRPWQVGERVSFAPMLVDIPGMGVLRDVGLYDVSTLLPVPEHFSDQEGAAFWMGLLTTAGAMDMAGLDPRSCAGRVIAFTAAAGGVGCIGLKLAGAWGAVTVAVTRDDGKTDVLSRLADHAVIARTPGDLASELRARSVAGVDVVIDPLGGDYVGAAVDALAPGGQYVCYEWLAGATANVDIERLMANDAGVHGFTIFRLVRHPGLLDKMIGIGMDFAEDVRPVLHADYGFDDAPKAFMALARGGHVGKITVSLRP